VEERVITRPERSGLAVCASVLGVAVVTVTMSAQQRAPQQNPGNTRLEIVAVRDNIYVIGGAGANIVASAGRDGFFLVDTGLEQNADAVLAAVRDLQKQIDLKYPPLERWGAEGHFSTLLEPYYRSAPPKPIRYVVNTTFAPDHIGANARIRSAGKTFTGGNVAGEIDVATEGAAILAHEELLGRMGQAKMPAGALPTDTYFGDHLKLSHFFNGEGVMLIHAPAATTDGDSFVHFRRSDVIATGDIFRMSAYPMIDVDKGGSIQGVLAALNRIIDMSVAEFRTEGGTMFVGGHGRIGDLADLTYYRDMCTIIRDRIQDLMKKGMTLAQIKAAKPSEDWDSRFGTDPAWTPDMFVEAIFKGLSAK
jgi:glyoxylase-like metal-dependent hydrolase (beta-lactamase superfamily II)